MLCAKRRLFPLQRPLVYLLGQGKLALVCVEDPKVVNYIKYQRVLCANRSHLTLQRLVVHLLGQGELAHRGFQGCQPVWRVISAIRQYSIVSPNINRT